MTKIREHGGATDNFVVIGSISLASFSLFLMYGAWCLRVTSRKENTGTEKLRLQMALFTFGLCEFINSISLLVERGYVCFCRLLIRTLNVFLCLDTTHGDLCSTCAGSSA